MSTLAEVMADGFDEWLFRMHGVTSSCDHEAEASALAEAAVDWFAATLEAHAVKHHGAGCLCMVCESFVSAINVVRTAASHPAADPGESGRREAAK